MSDDEQELTDFDEDARLMVYEIHGDVKRIEQHLDELNGSVARHEGDISELDSRLGKIEKKVHYGVGAVLLVSLTASAIAGAAGLMPLLSG